MNRRRAIGLSAQLGVAMMAAPMVNVGRFRLFASQQEYSARAIRLVRENLVIDMCNSFKSLVFRRPDGTTVIGHWAATNDGFTEEDSRRYTESGITVFGLGWDLNIARLAQWNSFLLRHPDRLIRIDEPDDFERAKASGRIGIMLTSQDSSHFDEEDEVDRCFGLGQMASGLVHNRSNTIGTWSFDPEDLGLKELGAKIVGRMNDVGMAVDLAHCSDRTALDTIATSRVPVIISHTNARALNPGHTRCVPDDIIRKVAANGGVIGITFIRFLVHHSEPTTVDHLINHYDHVRKLVGIEHVGIGSDFDLDGLDALPEIRDQLYAGAPKAYNFHGGRDQIEPVHHAKRVYDFVEALIRRKYSDQEIGLILSGNFKRVLTAIWGARRR